MRLLYFGDIVGRAGRDAVVRDLPEIRRKLDVDFVAICGENAAHGFGITPKICEDLYAAGADAITLGNHAWDAKEIIPYIDGDPKLIRPANFPPGTPGRGAGVYEARGGRKVLVVQVMGRVFMDPLDDPFPAVARELAKYPLGGAVAATIVDVHAEATSEKMAIGHYCDGKASLVAGTHTHVPTADAWILPGGTAYVTDLGMCGDYDSVIGMDKSEPLHRFTRKMSRERMQPAGGEATISGVFVETDDRTGKALRIQPIRQGGRLPPAWLG